MRKGKHNEILARIEHSSLVDIDRWEELKRDLAPISDTYLRSTLRESGKPLHPVVEGVRTANPQDAKRTLLALAKEYQQAASPADKRNCRDLVIEAKQRLRRRIVRQDTREAREILLWVSTWLENPTVFSDWLNIREKTIADANL